MNAFVLHVMKSGELDSYWSNVQRTNDFAIRSARKVSKEQKHIAYGSQYDSDEDDPLSVDTPGPLDSDWSEEESTPALSVEEDIVC